MRNQPESMVALATLMLLGVVPVGSRTVAAGADLPTWKHLSSTRGELPAAAVGRQAAAWTADLDKDGVNDFLVAGWADPSMVWFRRTDAGWKRYLLDDRKSHIEAGGAVWDIDGDGDLDVLQGGSWAVNEVWWWENPYPHYDPGTPWPRHTIKDWGAKQHHDQIFGDFDGDGAMELVLWNQKGQKLFIADVPAEPRNQDRWNFHAIWSWPEAFKYEGFAKADIDRDGQVDLVGGGQWFKHQGGRRFAARIVDAGYGMSRSAAGDFVRGGWLEIVLNSGDGVGPLALYQQRDEEWHKKILVETIDHGHTLQAGDINGDGELDLYAAEMNTPGSGSRCRQLVLYGDGRGHFATQVVSTGIGTHEGKLADLDGDGDLDILQKDFQHEKRIDIWLNNGTTPPPDRLGRWQRHVVDPDKPWRAVFIAGVDVDGDAEKDIVTGGWWYRNPGRAGGAWARRTIGEPLRNMAAVHDFDGDGDADILGTTGKGSSASAEFVWARNDGRGRFEIHRNIENGDGDFLQGVAVARFRENGPLQVALSWHIENDDEGVQLLTVPTDPARQRWTCRRISTISMDEAVDAGDVDRDGDLDLLLGTRWLQNDGESWTTQLVNPAEGKPDRNRLVDLNRDGRLDALSGYEYRKLAWYEQGRDPMAPWLEHVIAGGKDIIRPMSLDVADLDGDGDVDLVVGEHNLAAPTSSRLIVLENADGYGQRWRRHLIHRGDEHHDGAQLVDIDHDGDLDVLSLGWSHGRVLLYENRSK